MSAHRCVALPHAPTRPGARPAVGGTREEALLDVGRRSIAIKGRNDEGGGNARPGEGGNHPVGGAQLLGLLILGGGLLGLVDEGGHGLVDVAIRMSRVGATPKVVVPAVRVILAARASLRAPAGAAQGIRRGPG